jgi:type II secretory pathway component PulM
MRQTTQTARQATARQATAQQVQGSWTRERKIYLAIGVFASLAGVLLIAFSL